MNIQTDNVSQVLSYEQMQQFCWTRVQNVFALVSNENASRVKCNFYNTQAENIVFLSCIWFHDMAQTKNVINVASWQRDIVNNIETHIRKVVSQKNSFGNVKLIAVCLMWCPYLKQLIDPLLVQDITLLITQVGCIFDDSFFNSARNLIDSTQPHKWSEATSLITFSWFDSLLQNSPDNEQQQQIEMFAWRILLSNIPFEDNRFDDEFFLESDTEECFYFITHLLFIQSKYGLDKRWKDKFKDVEVKQIHKYFITMLVKHMKSPKIIHNNLEVWLELGICILLCTDNSQSVESCVDDLFNFLRLSIPNSRSGYLSLDLSTLYYVPKEFILHSDYHLHMLIGWFTGLFHETYNVNGFSSNDEKLYDSTNDYVQCNFTQIQTRLKQDGYLWIRNVVPRNDVHNVKNCIQKHIKTKSLKKGGFLVGIDGYVHDGREQNINTSKWKDVLEISSHNLLHGQNLTTFFKNIFHVNYKHCVEETWFRVKLPNEQTRVHRDLDYFLESGTVLPHIKKWWSVWKIHMWRIRTFIWLYLFRYCGPPCILCGKRTSKKSTNIYSICDICFEHSIGAYTVWIPLHDISYKDGPLCLVPKSHISKKHVANWHWPTFVQAGDIIIFDIKLSHASLKNQNLGPQRQGIRYSCDTRMVGKL